uniref:Putative secreted protein n=1 Tax=Anopheles darlingi TaxID=43151 RepID=A0A2M4DM84_ANODA
MRLRMNLLQFISFVAACYLLLGRFPCNRNHTAKHQSNHRQMRANVRCLKGPTVNLDRVLLHELILIHFS